MGHLPERMNTCVGTSRRGNGVLPRFEPRQRRLDGALHRGLIFLPLPSGKGRSVIFNFQSIACHGGAVARATL